MVAKKDVLDFISKNLCYYSVTGTLTWACDRANGKIKAGSIAGSLNNGYLQIRIHGKWFKVHRLVWLIETRGWPDDQIDHINRNKTDNRFTNLRDTSNYVNCLNRGRISQSGVVGVTYDKLNSLWLSQTYINGKSKNLGRYATIEEAKKAYITANLGR